jgi:hypothetical protein
MMAPVSVRQCKRQRIEAAIRRALEESVSHGYSPENTALHVHRSIERAGFRIVYDPTTRQAP